MSARAASILLENGFTNVTPMLGGFAAWIDAGYPTEP
ncbi:MAG TPA: rhodanese-like domain-containing protein [Anaerolineales bacterium]|nr:rhodanese-like domain-containing protein [Anaerolineales bacterium]